VDAFDLVGTAQLAPDPVTPLAEPVDQLTHRSLTDIRWGCPPDPSPSGELALAQKW